MTKEQQDFWFNMKRRGTPVPTLNTTDMVRHHNRGSSGETLKHFIAKSVCSWLLYNKGIPHFTEYEFDDGTTADVFNALDGIAIEFEAQGTGVKKESKISKYRGLVSRKMVSDLLVVNLDTLPANFNEMAREIEKRLGL